MTTRIVTTLCVLGCIAIYSVWPSPFIALSELLLQGMYTRVSEVRYGGHIPVSAAEALFVIARPPHTSYDTLLTTVPACAEEPCVFVGEYVADSAGTPVGTIRAILPRGTVAVTLFGSPRSRELFALGDRYVTEGKGVGSGLELLVPATVEARVSDPVTHQNTGRVIGVVVSVDAADDATHRVLVALTFNQFQVAQLHMLR